MCSYFIKGPIQFGIIKLLFEKFSNQKEVSIIYGDPIEAGERKVVPVAKVKYLFGGGGGVSDQKAGYSSGHGEGGGGYISVTPVGVYDITPEKTTFKPTVDLKFGLVLLTVTTFGFSLLKKSNLKREK